MKVKTVIYSKSYEMVTPFGLKYWEKIGIEAEIEGNDNTQDCLKVLKDQVEHFHTENNKEVPYQEPVTKISKETETEADKVIEKLFKQVKTKLSKYSNQEEAIAYLSTTEFKHNIELKQIINNLNPKN